MDINPLYIAQARRMFPGHTFTVGDAGASEFLGSCYRTVYMNSLLHHLDDAACGHLLRAAGRACGENGAVHILDLVLPDNAGPVRWLARYDRGEFARPLSHWRRLVGEELDITHC